MTKKKRLLSVLSIAAASIIGVVLGVLLCIFLFIFLPAQLFNLIFNNNAGTQLADYNVKAAEVSNAYYLKVTDSIVTPLSISAQMQGRR